MNIAPIQTEHEYKASPITELWWRITDWLEDHVPFWFNIRNGYWYVYHRIHQSHMIDTRIQKGSYCDIVGLIQYGLFELVDDYVSRNREDAFATVDYDHDEQHQEIKAKIIEILYFKNVKLPELQAAYDKLIHEHFEKYPVLFGKIDERTGLGKVEFSGENDSKCKEEFELMDKLEANIENEIQRILHMIIDIRPWLWS